MIHFFNKKEVFVTFSMSEQGKICDILFSNNIDYKIKTANRRKNSHSSSKIRPYTTTVFEKSQMNEEFIVYVKDTDFEKARKLISEN